MIVERNCRIATQTRTSQRNTLVHSWRMEIDGDEGHCQMVGTVMDLGDTCAHSNTTGHHDVIQHLYTVLWSIGLDRHWCDSSHLASVGHCRDCRNVHFYPTTSCATLCTDRPMLPPLHVCLISAINHHLWFVTPRVCRDSSRLVREYVFPQPSSESVVGPVRLFAMGRSTHLKTTFSIQLIRQMSPCNLRNLSIQPECLTYLI